MSFSQYVNGNILNLSNQQSLEIHQLITFLQSNTNIKHLHLISCGIDSKGAEALAKSQHLKNFTTLHLEGNDIRDEGAEALAKSQYLKNLTMLDLSRNNIGDEGAKELSKLLNLTILYLSRNNISDEGVKELTKLTNLIYLDLSENNIGDEGAKVLIKALNDGKFPGLDFLGLKNKDISTSIEEKLNNVLKFNIKHADHINSTIADGENQSVYYEELKDSIPEREEQQRRPNKKGHNVNFKKEVQVVTIPKLTQVDILTVKLEEKSRQLRNLKKHISELQEVFGKKIQELASEKGEYIDKLAKKEKELQDLKKQLNGQQKCFGEKTSKLTRLTRGLEKERDLAVDQKSHKEEDLKQAQQEIDNLKKKLEREQKLHSDTVNKARGQSRQYKAQLAEKEKALIDLRKSVQELEQVIENLNGQIVKLGEERDLILAQKLAQEDELQWTKAQLEWKEEKLNRAQQNLATLQEIFEREVQKNDDLTRKNNQLTEDKDLSAANAQNRKQSKYTSFPFFIVAGTFAVVASLETRYLAVWAALALPALFFFALGCHCLYKENTALSDVKVDQRNNLAIA